MNLGNKIRELRRAQNLTQEQLAASLNISAQAVSKWEMGASYPDMTMIPTLAAFFKVSLDELFDFDVKNVEKEIEEIRLEFNKYFWSDFDKAEQILLDGLKSYPASVQLKTELFELYAYNADRGDEHINKAFELGSHIISVSQDVFCTCRTKANIIHIYKYLELEKGEEHYEDIRKIIETLPYMYPYMLNDRMRLSASHIKGEEGMQEAKVLRNIEWQELFIACDTVGHRYFEMEEYENAMASFQESVDVIERFMYPDKMGYDAYPIGGTHANHAITLLSIAACMHRLGRTDGMDALIDKAKHIYFDTYDQIELWDYEKTMTEMLTYFTKEYNNKKLDAYKPLDLSEIEKKIAKKKR
ncbi:MAG: helix-turn-helix domain-containing protein [Ruminococcaceae bacterium]|nr:helix-turn-helix domain-containing protein [Oscillospiraceae bacterium]